MAAWDNYKRLKAAGKVTVGVQEVVGGGTPYIVTTKNSYDPETGTARPSTGEVTDIKDGHDRKALLEKEIASIDAWLIDAQAAIDAWNAAQPPEQPA